jgi:hypothetical protein
VLRQWAYATLLALGLLLVLIGVDRLWPVLGLLGSPRQDAGKTLPVAQAAALDRQRAVNADLEQRIAALTAALVGDLCPPGTVSVPPAKAAPANYAPPTAY